MIRFSHIPMIRILTPIFAGIIIYSKTEYNFNIPDYVLIMGTILVLIMLSFRFLLSKFRFRHIPGILITIFLVVTGFALAQSRYLANHPNHFSNYHWENSHLRIRITEPVSEKTNSYQITGEVTHVIRQDSLVSTVGKKIIYFEKDKAVKDLFYGDILLIPADYQEVNDAKNPNTFQYKRFLSRQNIFHQSYHRTGSWYFTDTNEGNPFMKMAHHMRQKAIDILENNGLTGREFSVASALLLGYRDYLDEELMEDFAGAGAMHILCVSGLHVGIIFLFLNALFSFFTKIKYGIYYKSLIIILIIWFYAAITGMSPSVMRASTMFSFLAIGQTLKRATNTYNTLASSALILVLLDPFIIFKIGFQLSYIAVISIVAIQPLLYKQVYFKNKIVDKAWAIITVSIAAQLGTGPLAVHYFNQFPNYFILANLAVIPLTGLIIQWGVLFFMLSPLEMLGSLFAQLSLWAGKLLSLMIFIMHKTVSFIENMPWSTSSNIYITFTETMIIFAIIAALVFFSTHKNKHFLTISLVFLLFLSVSFSFRLYQQTHQQQLVIYNMSDSFSMDIFRGKKCYSMVCEKRIPEPRDIKFNIEGNRLSQGIKPDKTIITPIISDTLIDNALYINSNYVYYEDTSLKIVDESTVFTDTLIFPDTLDIVVLTGDIRIKINELMNHLRFEKLVIDASSSYRRNHSWIKECRELGLNCWSVRDQGAYVHTLTSVK
ncbi:MAG: ComEC/Rec2 family competence protein [Bacteroidales bacterium]